MILFAHIGGVPFEELLPGVVSVVVMMRAWLSSRQRR